MTVSASHPERRSGKASGTLPLFRSGSLAAADGARRAALERIGLLSSRRHPPRPSPNGSYTTTSSAIFAAMAAIESSAVLKPLREPSKGLTSRSASYVVSCTTGMS